MATPMAMPEPKPTAMSSITAPSSAPIPTPMATPTARFPPEVLSFSFCGCISVLFESAETFDETLPPGGVGQHPVELAFGLQVRSAAALGHDRYAFFTHQELRDPGRHFAWRFGGKDIRQERQPDGDGSGLVVDDVVDTGCAAIHCRYRCAGDVLYVDERPDAGPVAHDGDHTFTDHVGDGAVPGDSGSRSVEEAATQGESFDVGGHRHRVFEVADGREGIAKPGRRIGVERVLFRLDRSTHRSKRPAAEALGDKTAGANLPRGQ